MTKLAIGEISNGYLVSVDEETSLSIALSDTPKTGFVATRPISQEGYIYKQRESK